MPRDPKYTLDQNDKIDPGFLAPTSTNENLEVLISAISNYNGGTKIPIELIDTTTFTLVEIDGGDLDQNAS